MAGWSILILRNLQSNGFCLDIDDASLKVGLDGIKDHKLRCSFDQILSVFLKEISLTEDTRPLPAMLGDGRCVDLFKLFWVVREKGGYHSVSKYGLWASVAEESGLGSGLSSSVKLIYIKYLDSLDRWVRRNFKSKSLGGDLSIADSGGDLDLLSLWLQTEFKDLLCDMSVQKEIVEEPTLLDLEKNEFRVSPVENMNEVGSATESGGGKKCVDDDEEVMTLDPCVVNEEDAYSRKRKRETLSGMLNWVTEIAKNPGDPEIGLLLEASKRKENGDEEFQGLALVTRKALLQTRHVYMSSESSLLQKKQKMHPSMYEDQIGADHQSIERLRCSRRLLSQKKSYLRSCSESSETTQSDSDISPCIAGMENHPKKQSLGIADSLTADRVVNPFDDEKVRKRVPVGPLFQAEVPEWTGVASESDSKWLGMQHWPLIMKEHNTIIERHPIGKGRQDSCGCPLLGSVECVRFHIAEKRVRLKLELGSAFYNWRFHCMGEEVSLSWTQEEEKKFKSIVRLNPPSLYKCFWDQAFRCFPTKNWKSLVSYYFNVFLLRRRSYQNRVTPHNIDSDDDESELGSVSNGFGHEAVKLVSKSMFCAQNNQCIDL